MSFSTYLTQISDVSIYPLISLSLFVLFFIGVTVWVYSLNKTDISKMEQIPFDDK